MKEGPSLVEREGAQVLVCAGCKHYRLVDNQYTFCSAQPCETNRAWPNPKFGKQTFDSGYLNAGCPFKGVQN